MKLVSDSGYYYYHYRSKQILNEFLMLAHTYQHNLLGNALALLMVFFNYATRGS